MKELFQKFGQRTFGANAGPAGLAFFNDAMGLGLEFRMLVFVGVMGFAWSVVETARDIARMKYAAADLKLGAPPTPPKTS